MRRPLEFVAGWLVAMAVACVSTTTYQPPPTQYFPSAVAPVQQAGPAAPVQPPVSAEALAMRERGDAAMATRDAVTARLFYERAAHAGDPLAALRLGMTYDPGFLWRTHLSRAVEANPELAAFWYGAARDMGETRADQMLAGLARLTQPPAPAAKPANPVPPVAVPRPAPGRQAPSPVAAPPLPPAAETASVAAPPGAAHTDNRITEPHTEKRMAWPAGQAAAEPDPLKVPAAARPYQRAILREARMVWGMTAPTSVFGAQIQTESAWHEGAHSKYAAGLAQFIPSTAQAMAKKYPATLGQGDPLNPQWAIRALVQYDHDLYSEVRQAAEGCDRWAFTLSAYNGGFGWISRDRDLCDQSDGCDTRKWFGNVERHTSRSPSNAHENREYPRRILLQYQPAYAPWGGFVKCGG